MGLREQPWSIPCCEVLGAGQIAQTLTFSSLTQSPKVSGWSLPHSGSAPGNNTSPLEGPDPSSWTIAWIPRELESLIGVLSSWDAQSSPGPQKAAKEEPEKPPFQCGLTSPFPGPTASLHPGLCPLRDLLVKPRIRACVSVR